MRQEITKQNKKFEKHSCAVNWRRSSGRKAYQALLGIIDPTWTFTNLAGWNGPAGTAADRHMIPSLIASNPRVTAD